MCITGVCLQRLDLVSLPNLLLRRVRGDLEDLVVVNVRQHFEQEPMRELKKMKSKERKLRF